MSTLVLIAVPPALAARTTDGLVALYDFTEGSGTTIDNSGPGGAALDLVIETPGAVEWIAGGGLAVDSAATIRTAGAATAVSDAVQASNAFTVEAWVQPASATITGNLVPRRIVSMEVDNFNANFTLGQGNSQYGARFRTTTIGTSGSDYYAGTPSTAGLQHVVMTRSASGVLTMYVDGASVGSSNAYTGDTSNWDDSYRLSLANSALLGREFLGDYCLVAIYDKALSPTEVTDNHDAGCPLGAAGASATVGITPGGALGVSSFDTGALVIENTSSDASEIVSVSIDLSTALFPDMVFDPNGDAGDALGKCLTPDSGAAATGFVAPTDPCDDPFSAPHNGDPLDGFDVISMDFTDFGPGETFSFSTDIDPNNIKDASTTGFAGSVSGLELTGATVTIQFSSGTLVNETFSDGSAGGSVATIDGTVVDVPVIDGVVGVSLGSIGADREAATVLDAAQTVTVSGTPNDDVIVLVVEGGLTTGAAYLVEEFDANEALSAANIDQYPATIEGDGDVDVPITLNKSSVEGGYNLIGVFTQDAAGKTGAMSNVVVLRLGESIAQTGVGAGGSVSTDGDGDGAQSYDPVEATVDLPSAGGPYDVTITEQTTTTSSGFTLLGHEFDITVSPGAPGAANPITLTFEVDSSLLGGTIDILKDGVLVTPCLAAGTANPDPCIESSTTQPDGDLEVVVLTTSASLWNFAEDVPAGNLPPVFLQNLGTQTSSEGATINLSAGAVDPDSGPSPLAYSDGGTLPPGLSINASTGDITGTIDAGASSGSPYSVVIEVTDGEDTAQDTFDWVVNVAGAGTVLYRINVGGPQVAAADASAPDWAADTSGSPSVYLTEGGVGFFDTTQGAAYSPIVMGDPSLPPSAPSTIFDTERYDVADAPEMAWSFPVTAGGTYEVRLFLAEIYNGITTSGERLFDVSVEGTVPAEFDDIDQFATAGAAGAFMVSTQVTPADGSLDLVFLHNVENPAVKGIEIIDLVPGLSASPSSHDFGIVEVGDSGTPQTFTITNEGDDPIETTAIAIIGSTDFSLAGLPSLPATLNAGENYTFDVDFDPTAPGAIAGSVVVTHDGPGGQLMIPLSGVGSIAAGGPVLFRVNGGGPAIADPINGDWESDSGGSSSYRTGGVNSTAGGNTANTWAPAPYTPAAGTPNEVFAMEAWGEMQWNFPVASGTPVEVRLYMQNSYTGTDQPGERIFDVAIDGNLVIDDLDLTADHGHLVATMYSFPIVADGDGIDIDFITGVENPLINAIEIVSAEPQPGVLGVTPAAYSFGTQLIGNTVMTPVTLTNLGDTGDQDITIADGDVTMVNGDFSHDFIGPVTLGPGEQTTFNAIWSPTSSGAVSATLTVVHDGVNSPVQAFFDGNGSSSISPAFSNSELSGESSTDPTSLQFGPDDRLYVSQQNGLIYIYTVVRNGPDDYDVVATESIDLVQNIQNHSDDTGAASATSNRQVTGLLVTGTAANPVIYVSSSDPQISVGNDSGLDTNSGTISRLEWTGTEWEHIQIVRGLPRSEENHSTNGLALDEATNTLYVIQGGLTNKGAPGNNFSGSPEYALSGALLSIDLDTVESMPTLTDIHGQDYKYDIPTLDDPTRANTGDTVTVNGQVVNVDIGDPFGGHNGLNQGMWDGSGPVQVYSPGYRNAYDVVFTEAGRLYTFDNGPNTGWGGTPVGEGPGGTCTNEFNEGDSTGYGDGLHYISGPGYYGGHPNPTRGNPTGAMLYIYVNSGGWILDPTVGTNPLDFGVDTANPVPAANPIECDYQIPGVDDGALAVINASTNGMTEYTASNFGGDMQGDLLAAAFNNNIYRFELNASGSDLIDSGVIFSGFGANPLDITAQGDTDVFPGTIWVAMHGADTIEVFEPLDFSSCVGGPGSFDEDGDGFSNDDELANGTNPCSPSDKPNDFDGDFISDLLDPDDDNDTILDENDPFAIDPDNGLTTSLPASCPDSGQPSTPTCLHMHDGEFGTTILGLGFTGLMTDSTNWLDQFDIDNLIRGGAASQLSVSAVPPGDAHQATNTQENGFQFGFDPSSDPFTLHTRIVQPFPASETPDTWQSAGMQFGLGTQDDYVKLVVSALTDGTGGGGIQLGTEIGGSFSEVNTSDPGVEGDGIYVDLWLDVDPTTGDVVATYAINDGPVQSAGATSVPLAWFTDAVALGVISTSNGATPFTANWDVLEAWSTPPDTNARALIEVTAGDANIDTSTFGNDSFIITNESDPGVQIESVTFDLTTNIFTDIVFDPDDGSSAGDTTNKCFEATSGGADTGLVTTDPNCDTAFSLPHQDGYLGLTIDFNDFDEAEVFGFSVDVDPTTIKGVAASGPGNSGSVSGLELAGSTVTVVFSNGDTHVATLFSDGSNGGSVGVAKENPAAAPSISVGAVGIGPATVTDASQTVTITGPANADYQLLRVEGALFEPPGGGFDVDPFEANSAVDVELFSGTLNGAGTADVAVTLTDSLAQGGLNHLVAVIVDPDGDTGDASPVAVVELVEEDTESPTVSIVAPTNNSTVAAPVALSGSMSDNVGVSEVRVEVYDRGTLMWWNGAGWQPTRTYVLASLDSATTWSYSFDPPSPISTAKFWMTAKAFDAAGNFSTQAVNNFFIE